MILVFLLIRNLFKMQFSSLHMPLMLEGIGIVIQDNFSENKGIAHIHHGKKWSTVNTEV